VRIGLTYDLRAEYLAAGYAEEDTAEFDRPDTIDAIERCLRAQGHETVRIGRLAALVKRLAVGERWDFVFNIAEGLHGFGREAVIPALLEAYGIPCSFSDPMVLGLALHKAMCKRAVRDLGVPTPDFAVIETEGDALRVDLPLPLFAKPVAEGTSKGCNPASKITRRGDLWPTCRRLIEQFRQPALVEAFLPGREVTIGLVGTGEDAAAIGTLEVVLLPGAGAEPEVYSYKNKENCEVLVKYQLADTALSAAAETLALQVWRGLGCRDAGRVDLRADSTGHLNFIEVNPLPGMNPLHSDLPILCSLKGVSFDQLMSRIMASALKRGGTGDAGGPRRPSIARTATRTTGLPSLAHAAPDGF
jgi:D-alanine-D-alanine ligase